MLLPEAMNQFTASGMLLVLMGGLMAYMKEVPHAFWRWIVGQTTVSIIVKDEDQAFEWTKEWLARQDFLHKVRRVDLDSSIRGVPLSLMPAPGRHLFWRNRRPFWLDFVRSDEHKGGDSWSAKRAETLHFSTLGRDRTILERFVEEVLESRKQSLQAETDLYAWHEHWWERQKAYSPRRMEAVILPKGDKEKLMADIRLFLASKDYYDKLGIPYHRGYVFYGPPGTGKTSLASAVGKEFGLSVYIINLSDFTDRELKMAMGRIPENSIVLFEDIDASGASKKRVDKKKASGDNEGKEGETLKEALGVTLSGLLNVLDGFYAPSGVLFIMTTNHIENLDPALLRPGRIDYRLLLDTASQDQKIALYQRFFPDVPLVDAESFVRQRPSTETMAEFQGLLLTLRKE